MASLTEFFNRQESESQKGISHKNNLIKRNIIAHMAVNGECTLSELTRELHISVPTITKLVQELASENIVTDLGKVETPGGRRPNVFGLASSAIYFAGVNIGRDNLSFLITDLQNNIVKEELTADFALLDAPECLDTICRQIVSFIDTCGVERAKILGLGVSICGRVNPATGRSYNYFTSEKQSLRDTIEERTGLRVMLENDTRARCYAEYTGSRTNKEEQDVLYLHLGRGLAIGIVTEGKLYYGKSGFAGEFGHIPFFDNEIICSCGKKGCLETEVSGIAVEAQFIERIRQGSNTILREKYNREEPIRIDDIIEAAKNDDNLSIELIEEVGEKAGKAVAFLINTFNPETVIVGGDLAEAGDYLMLPLKSATNKYSLNLVYKDTQFRLSKMSKTANAWGAAMLVRNQILGLC
ncbi:MAG: ROK family transcriptional regulator [Alistipes sp.]|nr:ROK family transcriptional regulator [Alistipes sp.]